MCFLNKLVVEFLEDGLPVEISITNVVNPLAKTCFEVMDDSQTFLFSVCDDDFQDGFPVSHAACDNGTDTVCNDEEPAAGIVTVTLANATYHVVVSKTPLNIAPDVTKGICPAGPCSLTFTNSTSSRPWYPWDVAGPDDGPPDGVVDLFNDIVGVIEHYCPNAELDCYKP